jgi:hypothetical protein
MADILQLPLCLYDLQRLVISVYYCLFSHNIMFPLTRFFHNGTHFLVIGGYFWTVYESVSLWYSIG